MGTAPSRFYGVLCEPKAPGKYPALLSVPGAGVRPYRGLAEMAARGIITLQVGIHGIPVTMDQSVYDSLGAGALANYNTFGLDNRDRYYYRRVYLGCVRANDFLTSHPKWDGVNLAVTGGSQGGALSIVTAALDPRVRGLAAYYPALSDVTGYLQNRAGGWPHMFRAADGPLSHRSPDKIETSRYYDVVNFARRVKVPGLYYVGLQRRDVPADVHVLGLQRHSRAEEIAAGARNRPQQHPRASRRGRRVAASVPEGGFFVELGMNRNLQGPGRSQTLVHGTDILRALIRQPAIQGLKTFLRIDDDAILPRRPAT